MNSGYPEPVPIGKITSGIEQGTLAVKIVDFVRQQLPAWRDHRPRIDAQSEVRLNSQLCKFLNTGARQDGFSMISFSHEEPQSGNRSVDLSACPSEPLLIDARQFSIYDPILVLECKRLPAPTADREMEYVTGNARERSGGIQRFKMGLHGAGVEVAAMIGYVQDRSPKHWLGTINSWISDLCSGILTDGCTWGDNELLCETDKGMTRGVTSYRSVHCRTGAISDNDITIYHLWVAMNKGNVAH